MRYNFDELIPRQGTQSIKWDIDNNGDMLPMWIADMDFRTAPSVITALQKRVEHGVLGYTYTPKEYYLAIIDWWRRRHSFSLQKDWIMPVSGVIPGLSAIIRTICKNGGKVIVQPPVYNHFFTTIEICGCAVVENNLLYNEGRYIMDYEGFAELAADPDTKLLLLSNPHNPTGRVWMKEELRKLGDICSSHGVVVVSDEIHADLVFNEHRHIPFASLGESYSLNSITCSAPSKSFNLAGVQVAYLFSENKSYREGIKKIFDMQEMILQTPFAIDALIAAYNDGEDWLDALRNYLYENYQTLILFCKERLPAIKPIDLEGTYLVWVDCTAIPIHTEELCKRLKQEQNVWLNHGVLYGAAGEGFIRINIACTRAILLQSLERFAEFLQQFS